ncbi:hypothetical protein MY8738_000620 [Beauveria namnaoensis]
MPVGDNLPTVSYCRRHMRSLLAIAFQRWWDEVDRESYGGLQLKAELKKLPRTNTSVTAARISPSSEDTPWKLRRLPRALQSRRRRPQLPMRAPEVSNSPLLLQEDPPQPQTSADTRA